MSCPVFGLDAGCAAQILGTHVHLDGSPVSLDNDTVCRLMKKCDNGDHHEGDQRVKLPGYFRETLYRTTCAVVPDTAQGHDWKNELERIRELSSGDLWSDHMKQLESIGGCWF